MSDVPYARDIITGVRKMPDVPRRAKLWLGKALQQLWREPPIRKARPKPTRMSAAIRADIRRLASMTDRHGNPAMTMHEIADHVNVRNIGRISYVLNGKKKKRRRITP